MTNALVRELSASPRFRYRQNDGRWVLSVKIISLDDDRIGFRYDRSPNTDKRRNNVIGVENRLRMSAEVAIIDTFCDDFIMGPEIVTAEIDYDYNDPDSLRDLSVITPSGKRQSSVAFSLGQLDSFDAAKVDAMRPLYEKLARKIVEGIEACEE